MGRKEDRIDELYHALETALIRLEHFWDVTDPFGTPVEEYYRDEIKWLYQTLYGEKKPEEVRRRLLKLRRSA